MDTHGQHVAGADLAVGAGLPRGIHPDGSGLDQLLRQGAGFDRAGEEQPPVEPLLDQALLGLWVPECGERRPR